MPSRPSSFSFNGKQVEIPEIARRLHVANVLEGSARKNGDQLRITVQLIRADEGYHLWSEIYDRKMDDIFKIQGEIAQKVLEHLKVTLLGETPKVRERKPMQSLAISADLERRSITRIAPPARIAIEWGSITLWFLHHGHSGFGGQTGLPLSTWNSIS